jgi:ribosomal protein L40E
MITCPACGKENEDSAVLCRRCRGPLRDEPEELAPEEPAVPAHSAAPAHPDHAQPVDHSHDQQPAATADEPTASSDSLGEVCRRCESYNEPGALRCSSCGYSLAAGADEAASAPAEAPALDKTPAHPFSPPHVEPHADESALLHDTPPEATRSVADELSALAISPEEAAEAGLSLPSQLRAPHFESETAPFHETAPFRETAPAQALHLPDQEPALDKTPPQAFLRPPAEAPSLLAKGKAAVAEAAGVAVGAATGVAAGAAAAVAGAVRRAPAAPEPVAPPPPPSVKAEPEQKACAECGAMNPPAARFCFDCGTPFAKKSAAPPPKAAEAPAKAVEPPPKAVEAPPKAVAPPSTAPAPRAVEPTPSAAEPEKIVEPPPRPAAPKPPESRPKLAEPAPLSQPRTPPASRATGWADSTEPGTEAPFVHVESPESTTETPPISLASSEPHPAEPGAHAEEEPSHPPGEPPLPMVQHTEPGHALEAGAFAESAPVAFEAVADRHAHREEPAAVEAPADLAVAHEAALFEEAAPHEAAAWDDPPAEPLPEPFQGMEPAAEPVEELAEPLTEPAPEVLAEPLAEPAPEELSEVLSEPLPEPAVEELSEPLAGPEPEPPFRASLVLEKGPAAGTALHLGRLENSVGGAGAGIELADDPSVAPHAATVAFAEDRLVLRDEGSANGVYVRVREAALLEAGDHFYAGERLLRFDGPCELPQTHEGEVPYLGAPRPPGVPVRLTEVVAGGRTGRTCHRAGPTISIGRTGCDMNFPADSLLGARHAEVRLGDDGSVSLVDLGQGPSGLFMRVRARGALELQAGDVVRVGEQELRVEIG